MKIQQLLNPFCGDRHANRSSESPTPASQPVAMVLGPKRHKIPKDAPVFSEGNNTVGIVNFIPHEAGNDDELLAQHRRFRVYPLGEIAKKGVRHIPYNSDKKDFLEKTGRDAFEMFQYTYKVPGEDREYVVVWDYNVGLVRMTPFFKSLKYSKTIPAKALRENPGLKDISYSITGGALVCQGYWMPYQAAKAIAATFCYEIRWALTPVFGNDFPFICLPPDDDCFAKFMIDPAIVQFCTQETTRFRELGPAYRVHSSDSATQTVHKSASSEHKFNRRATPKHNVTRSATPAPVETRASRPEQPPFGAEVTRQLHVQPTDAESGYGTDTERNDRYLLSPEVSPRTRFTPINRTQSPPIATPLFASSPVRMRAPPALLSPTSAPYECSSETFRTKRTHSKVSYYERSSDEVVVARPPTATTVDSAHGSEVSGIDDYHQGHADMDVAEMLLSLRTAGQAMPPLKRTRRESWSSK